MDKQQLKIARLEREQKRLILTIERLSESVDIMVQFIDMELMTNEELVTILMNQKNALHTLEDILMGE